MKVKELIDALEELGDPEAHVVVRGYEGGVNDVGSIEKLTVRRDVNTEWYYGRHEAADQADAGQPNVVQAYELVGGEG